MAKTIVMPGEELTDEQRAESRKLTQEREQRDKDRFAQEIENQKNKIKASLQQMLNTRIAPEEDRIVVWPDPVEMVTAGGIIKVEETIKKEEQAILMGTVLAVGPGKALQQNQDLTNYLLLNVLQYGSDITEADLEKIKEEIKKHSTEIPLHPGDHIMYGRFAGTKVEDPDTKESLLIMRPMDIFAKIRK